jgi:predicted metal-binding membrane protein
MAAAMPRLASLGPRDVALTFAMWAVMMVAMMVPSAAPMILVFSTFQRRRREADRPHVGTGVFLLGYLLVWMLFSAGAAAAQWGLHQAALLSPAMGVTSAWVGGAILAGAGIFQWMPLKNVCLDRCRTPLSFVMTEWREGTGGAFVMGFRHGAFCAGCCWMLMAVLFAVGVMNLAWVAAIAAFVFVEKAVPRGRWVSRLSGVALCAWGAWVAWPR